MSQPLAGRRLLVTRRREQAESLVAALAERGADVAVVPTLAIAAAADTSDLDAALRDLAAYDWVAFTSANAVVSFADRAGELGLGLDPWPERPRVASVGPATRTAIQARLPAARIAAEPESEFRAEGLAAALATRGVAGCRVLLPVSDRARDELATRLEAAGARVERVVAYRTLPATDAGDALRQVLPGLDAALFASPSAVTGFVSSLGAGASRGVPAAVIGPTTLAAAREAGMRIVAVAEPSTAEGLVASLEQALAPRRS